MDSIQPTAEFLQPSIVCRSHRTRPQCRRWRGRQNRADTHSFVVGDARQIDEARGRVTRGPPVRRISASQRTTYTKMKTLESPVHELACGGSNGSSEWYLCNEALSCPVSRGGEGGETLIKTVDQILTTARIGLLMAPIPRFPALVREGWCTCCLLVSSGRSGVVVVVVGECSSV